MHLRRRPLQSSVEKVTNIRISDLKFSKKIFCNWIHNLKWIVFYMFSVTVSKVNRIDQICTSKWWNEIDNGKWIVYLWTASWSLRFGNSVRDPEFPILRWRVRRLPNGQIKELINRPINTCQNQTVISHILLLRLNYFWVPLKLHNFRPKCQYTHVRGLFSCIRDRCGASYRSKCNSWGILYQQCQLQCLMLFVIYPNSCCFGFLF